MPPKKATVPKRKVGAKKPSGSVVADVAREDAQPSNGSGNDAGTTCAICEQPIVDGKDQALYSLNRPFPVLLLLSGKAC